MITQQDNESVCSIMYKIRDSVNENNTRTALALSYALSKLLEVVVQKENGFGCLLNCEIEKK